MKESDRQEFSRVMAGLAETFNQKLSAERTRIYWNSLLKYEIARVNSALNQIVLRSKFFPKPAEIIELIDAKAGNKHMPSSEAWAMSLAAIDENNTVVWTDEMHKAWVVAKSVIDIGDDVGARRAFIESYDRLVNESVLNNKPVSVTVSLGFDKRKREMAINCAVFTGLLSQDTASQYLPKQENNFTAIENKIATKSTNIPQSILALKSKINTGKRKNHETIQAEKDRANEALRQQYEQQKSQLVEREPLFSSAS